MKGWGLSALASGLIALVVVLSGCNGGGSSSGSAPSGNDGGGSVQGELPGGFTDADAATFGPLMDGMPQETLFEFIGNQVNARGLKSQEEVLQFAKAIDARIKLFCPAGRYAKCQAELRN